MNYEVSYLEEYKVIQKITVLTKVDLESKNGCEILGLRE